MTKHRSHTRTILIRVHVCAIGTLLLAASAAPAQQTPTDKDKHSRHAAQNGLPTVEQQLKVLAVKLDLTHAQQSRIKPILADLHDVTEKAIADKTLSPEQRMDKVAPQRYKADKQMREILTEDQKKKLDQYEQGPHPEMGDVSGESPEQR